MMKTILLLVLTAFGLYCYSCFSIAIYKRYRIYKKQKERLKKEEAFRKMMKELEMLLMKMTIQKHCL